MPIRKNSRSIWKLFIPCILIIYLGFLGFVYTDDDIGTIWQITDFHYDANYSTAGDPKNMCHSSKSESPWRKVGVYGNYSCDSPLALVVSAVKAMKTIEPNPDFILWTGDSIPHIKNSDNSMKKVYEVIANMTHLLKEVFDNVTIYPTIGNHDAFPSNQIPADEGRDYYDQLLKASHWNILLKPEDQDQFLKGGFYSCLIHPGLRLLSLNTNLYYVLDKENVAKPDPANQFQWLDQQLRYASDHGEKIIIMAHVPPGGFERSMNITWMYPAFNDRLVEILMKHNHVISSQIFGHEHTDSFKIIYDGKIPVSVLLLAPAVTPMNSTLPGAGPNNPGIRLYFYRRTTGEIINYHQYYLNLGKIHPGSNSANWELEYRALEDVLLTDMSPESFDRYVKDFTKDKMAKFQKYLYHNTVSYGEESAVKPDAKQFLQQVCAISHLSTDAYQTCISQSPKTYLRANSPEGSMSQNKGPELPIYTYYVVTAFAALTFLVLVVMSVVRKQCTQTPSLPFRYRPLTNDCQYVQRERAT